MATGHKLRHMEIKFKKYYNFYKMWYEEPLKVRIFFQILEIECHKRHCPDILLINFRLRIDGCISQYPLVTIKSWNTLIQNYLLNFESDSFTTMQKIWSADLASYIGSSWIHYHIIKSDIWMEKLCIVTIICYGEFN